MYQSASKLALFAALLFTAAGCSSDKDVQPERRFISFQMNGKIMLSEQRNKAAYRPGNLSDTDPTNDQANLLIMGFTYGKDVISIEITGAGEQLTPGVYTSDQPGNAFLLEKFSTIELIKADETTGSWSVTIHQVKDGLAIGEFTGVAVSQDMGTIHPITAGYFKLKY
ncbi:hypothetical protein [Chitinophaga deserti]|uniref:hypothetical protein n=1 Tax=Chitinophaga deserti TaxID=2164099 RepID=UPI000D6A83E7|nr:hypothetical protein [Chitinophaga deserti]